MKESALFLTYSLPLFLCLSLCRSLCSFAINCFDSCTLICSPFHCSTSTLSFPFFAFQSHQVQLHHYHGLFKFINMPRSEIEIECKPMTSIKSFFLLSALLCFGFCFCFAFSVLHFCSASSSSGDELEKCISYL